MLLGFSLILNIVAPARIRCCSVQVGFKEVLAPYVGCFLQCSFNFARLALGLQLGPEGNCYFVSRTEGLQHSAKHLAGSSCFPVKCFLGFSFEEPAGAQEKAAMKVDYLAAKAAKKELDERLDPGSICFGSAAHFLQITLEDLRGKSVVEVRKCSSFALRIRKKRAERRVASVEVMAVVNVAIAASRLELLLGSDTAQLAAENLRLSFEPVLGCFCYITYPGLNPLF